MCAGGGGGGGGGGGCEGRHPPPPPPLTSQTTTIVDVITRNSCDQRSMSFIYQIVSAELPPSVAPLANTFGTNYTAAEGRGQCVPQWNRRRDVVTGRGIS